MHLGSQREADCSSQDRIQPEDWKHDESGHGNVVMETDANEDWHDFNYRNAQDETGQNSLHEDGIDGFF